MERLVETVSKKRISKDSVLKERAYPSMLVIEKIADADGHRSDEGSARCRN